MVKVTYDIETGTIIGFYPSGMGYNTIPEPNITITDEFYTENLTQLISSIYIIIDGEVVEKYSTDIDKLNILKGEKLNKINVTYINLCRRLDDNFNCYRNRTELNLLGVNDESNYQITKTLYISATLLKREMELTIENSTDYNEVNAILVPIEWETYTRRL